MGTDSSPPPEEEPDVKSRLCSLLQNESMSDVTFVVDDPPRSIPCHKLILGLGSKVFEAMFFGFMAEKWEVRAPDVTETGFNIMLRYLYTDEVTIDNESDAFDAAYVSKKYLIRPLFRDCEKYLLASTVLKPHTVFPLYEKASFLELKRLQARCLRYVSRHAKKLLRSKHLASASASTFQDVLKLDLMDIDSELDVIEAVWEWGKERCVGLDLECTDSNIRDLTRDLVQHVRFLSVRKGDLQEVLDRFRLLDTSDQLTVLWNLAMSASTDCARLPSNLSNVTRTRSVTNCSRMGLPTAYKYDCTLSSFDLLDHRATAEVTVSGPPIVLIGAVLACNPIPCYSSDHRTLDVHLSVFSPSTRSRSSAKSSVKANVVATSQQQLEREIQLDDYVALSEGESVTVTVEVVGEGIKVMQCPKMFTCFCDETEIAFHFDVTESDKIVLPFKEFMYAPS